MLTTVEDINEAKDNLIQELNNQLTEFTRLTGVPVKFINIIDKGIEIKGSKRHMAQVISIALDANALFL